MFVYFRWNVESAWFGISLYEKLLSFVVNETVFVQSFNQEFYTCLDVTSNVNLCLFQRSIFYRFLFLLLVYFNGPLLIVILYRLLSWLFKL